MDEKLRNQKTKQHRGNVSMKNLVILILASLFFTSCTPMKQAQTSIARGIGGSKVIEVNGHEVYCSQGRVCAEVDVLSIDADNSDYGKVRVTFKNRTGDSVLVKIKLEIRNENNGMLDETRPENFPIPPTQEATYEYSGISRKNSKVRVLLNAAN